MNQKIDRACYKILAESGVIAKEQLELLQREAKESNTSFAESVVRSGLVREQDLLELYAKSAGTTCVDLKTMHVDKSVTDRVPVKFAAYYKFFPVVFKDQKLTIATAVPFDVHTLDEIRFALGYEIQTVFASTRDIAEKLEQHYGLGAETVDKILAQKPKDDQSDAAVIVEEKEQDIEKLAENASVVQLVNQIILEAYKRRASDIHIEPYRGKVRLRYRIDGSLQEANVPPEMVQFIAPILSRIKIMANLNIVERRLPQDGKARVKTQEQFLNLRVSSVPTPHGESMVVRILPTKMILSLEQLGFEPENLMTFKDLIQKPNGIIFVTGPTGSGKSTTLYAGLKSINAVERKIITLEDPVEYEMEDMTQMQVMPEIGLTFARGLRSILRHDPDVMMVGEVRDLETADIAIRAALTGHLMLSTLHTNDAASGVTRLLDIGIEPYLVASSIIAFVAQRLVRVVCPNCREEDKTVFPQIKEMIARDLKLASAEEVNVFRGKGCAKCSGSGFLGRLAIHEIMVLDEEIRKLIFSSAPADVIKKEAMARGMNSMRQDGWKKVIKGLTTPDEIVKATPPDEVYSTKPVNKTIAETDYIIAPEGTYEHDSRTRTQDEKPAEFIEERRKYIRIQVQLDVIFRPINVETNQDVTKSEMNPWEGKGLSDNLSAGGVAFRTTEILYPGDILDMKINFPDDVKPIECIAKTLRVKQLSMGGAGTAVAYQAAVCFLAIHSIDRLRIEKFCKTKSVK
ncbi:MAG: ATPase, T2SS/T4P/T4SS family [Candidatus Omnitrophica bacterium]|nr:ATPase, T2SS/T4P/T4SS family [Candidatus Omnitrophota bacterium]